jgi:GST-like protein
MDLYTFGTPNGHKISIALEELGLPYKTHKIDITKGDQHTAEFKKINPNAKIPALVDGGNVIFESVAVLIYLAEKTGRLLPTATKERYQCLSWCIFQAASLGPMFGQFGHFKVFAKEKVPHAIERYRTEVNRIMHVVETQLQEHSFLAGNEYTIADIATWPWIRGYQVFYKEKIDAAEFPNLMRWYHEIEKRPAVRKGLAVP